MNKLKNRKLLFRAACSAIVSDGYIADDEIQELRYIDESTPYFSDIDLSSDIDIFLKNYEQIGNQILNQAIEDIKKANLSPVMQLLILEVVLRIVYSDEKILDQEIEFIRDIRRALPVSDQIIQERFGHLDILFSQDIDQIKSSVKVLDAITTSKNEEIDFSQLYHQRGNK